LSSPYVGEIRIFAGNFNPAGWMLCDGALLPISEYDTLFNLIGTTYGGDGQSTFALPDLRGRLAVHQGTLTQNYVIGQQGGVESVTLSTQQIPNHSHPIVAENDTPSTINTDPTNHLYGNPAPTTPYSLHTGNLHVMETLQNSGGSQPHDNFQPYLCVNFIISLFGIYPSQT
jgi:microcystin-dependent protein